MDSAIKSKLQALLRLGLVSQTNVRRAMTLFSDPERYAKSPAYRTLMQEILVDVVDTILKNRVLYTALRSSLTKTKGAADASETVAATSQKLGESAESNRVDMLLRKGLVDKEQITAARKALKSKSNMKQMSMGKVYREMMINMLDSLVSKITGSPSLFNAFKYTMGKDVVEEAFEGGDEDIIELVGLHEDAQEILEANKPTNPSLWSKAKSMAKSKFKVYPSAYANGWAVKWYNSKGGDWKSVSEGKSFFQFANDLEEALTPARQAVIDRERKKASETMNRASTPTPERNKAYARGSRINYLELKGMAKKSDKQGSDYQVNKREHEKWRKTEKSMKESVEQIDELSKKTLASYVQKAHDSQSEKEFLKGHSMGKKYQAAREAEKRGVSTPPSKKTPLDKKYRNREIGIGRALNRLQKENTKESWEGSPAQAKLKKAKTDYAKTSAEMSKPVPPARGSTNPMARQDTKSGKMYWAADRRKKAGNGTRRASDSDYRSTTTTE
jgi:hypothetical protein